MYNSIPLRGTILRHKVLRNLWFRMTWHLGIKFTKFLDILAKIPLHMYLTPLNPIFFPFWLFFKTFRIIKRHNSVSNWWINWHFPRLIPQGDGEKKLLYYSWVSPWLHDPSKFVLESVKKPIHQQNHVFETLLCQVRIVKNSEKQLKPKDDKFNRL